MFISEARKGSSRHLIRTRDRSASLRENIPGRADRGTRERKARCLKGRPTETGYVYISSDDDPAGDGMLGTGEGQDRGAGHERARSPLATAVKAKTLESADE